MAKIRASCAARRQPSPNLVIGSQANIESHGYPGGDLPCFIDRPSPEPRAALFAGMLTRHTVGGRHVDLPIANWGEIMPSNNTM
jgi:hypothetical protein